MTVAKTPLLYIDTQTGDVRRWQRNQYNTLEMTAACVLGENFEAVKGRVALQEFLRNPGSLEIAHAPEAA